MRCEAFVQTLPLAPCRDDFLLCPRLLPALSARRSDPRFPLSLPLQKVRRVGKGSPLCTGTPLVPIPLLEQLLSSTELCRDFRGLLLFPSGGTYHQYHVLIIGAVLNSSSFRQFGSSLSNYFSHSGSNTLTYKF